MGSGEGRAYTRFVSHHGKLDAAYEGPARLALIKSNLADGGPYGG